jgi:hypothetical protein
MKFVITESRREQLIYKYLSDRYGGLLKVDEPRLDLIFFLKDNGKDKLTGNDIVFHYAKDKQHASIPWEMVRDIEMFTGDEWESRQFIMKWLKKTYGIDPVKLYQKF